MHGSKACGTGRKARRGVFKADTANRREPKPATETRQIALLWRVTNKCEITFPVSALYVQVDYFGVRVIQVQFLEPALRIFWEEPFVVLEKGVAWGKDRSYW
jgi:hypothetical protein